MANYSVGRGGRLIGNVNQGAKENGFLRKKRIVCSYKAKVRGRGSSSLLKEAPAVLLAPLKQEEGPFNEAKGFLSRAKSKS